MFGIGFSELVIMALIAIVVVGPERLPDIASYMGKLFGSFRKANTELRRAMHDVKPPDVMEIVENRIKEEAGLKEKPSDTESKTESKTNDNDKGKGKDQ